MRYKIEELAEELELDLGLLAGLYTSYFDEMKGEIEEMKTLLANKDLHMLERVVHNVKGVSANLAVQDVFEAAEKFDKLLKESNSDNAQLHVDKIIQLIANAEKEIRDFFVLRGMEV